MTTNETTPRKHRTALLIVGAVVALLVGFALGSTTGPDQATDASPGTTATVTAPAETVTASADPAATVTVTADAPSAAPAALMSDADIATCEKAMSTDASDIMDLVTRMSNITGDTMDAGLARDQGMIDAVTAKVQQVTADVKTVGAKFVADRDVCLAAIAGN